MGGQGVALAAAAAYRSSSCLADAADAAFAGIESFVFVEALALMSALDSVVAFQGSPSSSMVVPFPFLGFLEAGKTSLEYALAGEDSFHPRKAFEGVCSKVAFLPSIAVAFHP